MAEESLVLALSSAEQSLVQDRSKRPLPSILSPGNRVRLIATLIRMSLPTAWLRAALSIWPLQQSKIVRFKWRNRWKETCSFVKITTACAHHWTVILFSIYSYSVERRPISGFWELML